MPPVPSRSREIARQAVRDDLSRVAEQLFLARGYAGTTIEDVARQAGVSARTVYRYFPGKDDLLVARFARSAEQIVTTFATERAEQPLWSALSVALAQAARHVDEAQDTGAARRLHRVIFETPEFTARYLQQLHSAELRVFDVALETADETRPRPDVAEEASTRATIAKAFACLVAAQEAWYRADGQASLESLVAGTLAAG